MNEKLVSLRSAMKKNGVDAYIIFNTDPNNDEYIPKEYMSVKQLTGFTGDNAVVVVTDTFAGLWTDSRFFISGTLELQGSQFKLMKKTTNSDPSFIKYIADILPAGSNLALDGTLATQATYQNIYDTLSPLGININNNLDLTASFWPKRPSSKLSNIFVLDYKYTGKTAALKIKELIQTLNGNYQILTRPDDIAWLLNLRAADIDYCPVFRAFMLVGGKLGTSVLYTQKGRIGADAISHLAKLKVDVKDYGDIYVDLQELPDNSSVRVEYRAANSRLVSSINSQCEVINTPSPVQQWKGVKNDTELANIRKALVIDGVAMERFLHRMDTALQSGEKLTELSLAAILREERAKGEGFLMESFECISAFNAHAAMPHYAPTPDSDIDVTPNGVYLVDSGGQYLLGTTDITRTMPTGSFTHQFAVDYTLVLQGNIELAMAIFPEGKTGSDLDVLARMDMWKQGRDFGHGTGHGVGYCLNCHEGPHSISPVHNNVALKLGMVVTDEPGIYIEDKYGIRTENMLCVVKSQYSGFLQFEVLTLCHIDTRPVIKEMLTPAQLSFLNAYNKRVFDTLSPLMDADDVQYLRKVTAAI
jgi:Xaa-Pro aminopeptidase